MNRFSEAHPFRLENGHLVIDEQIFEGCRAKSKRKGKRLLPMRPFEYRTRVKRNAWGDVKEQLITSDYLNLNRQRFINFRCRIAK